VKKHHNISNLILKKSTQFLKISIALFAFSLLLISTFLILFTHQYLQIGRDFIHNHNLQMIEISLMQTEDGIEHLTFSDLPNIIAQLENTHPDVVFQGINQYQFNIGFNNKNSDEYYFLYGLDENAASFLGIAEIHHDTLYSSALLTEEIILDIPLVEIIDGGLASSDSFSKEFSTSQLPLEMTPFSLRELHSNQIFISFATYRNLIEKVYQLDWEAFVAQYNEANIFGIQAIRRIFIHVEDIRSVERVARTITDMGYATNYTFRSFDNFEQSIQNTIIISTLFIALIFLITSLYIVFSFNSYLKVQQKDMGILKHYGYDQAEIARIYSRNINQLFLKMSLFILIFILIFGILFLGIMQFGWIGIIILAILLPLVLINRIIYFAMIRKYAGLNILDLVKVNKEFE